MVIETRRFLHHFNPLPSCEGRRWSEDWWRTMKEFQSTPLTRGETSPTRERKGFGLFQSTPLIRGETRRGGSPVRLGRISIHSPHARGDAVFDAIVALIGISIHSPLARGDMGELGQVNLKDISIHSPLTRGDCELWHPYNQTQISIHPLIRGETFQPFAVKQRPEISIHSPHARGDSSS